MHMNPVSSSNISSIGYDPTSRRMRVEFQSGGLYEYDDVDQGMYDEFMGSDSLGRFFHENIKGMSGRKVDQAFAP